MDATERDVVIERVTERIRSFQAAERARDAERLVEHYACTPEFYFYHDGRRATAELMVTGVRKALPAVRSLDVTYGEIEVLALSAEYALASATFQRELVMNATGADVKQAGAVSWLWRNTDGTWLIVQGHISHLIESAK